MARVEQNDWLETFVAVADHGSFSGAARVVHRSQSRVSAHVAALERTLGTALFDRRHRPVELTDAGEAFLPYARQVLASLDEGTAAVDSLTGVRRGKVIVGSHPSAAAAFLPEVLRGFAAANPEVQVEISEGTTAGLGEALATGKLHLAIRSTTAAEPPAGLEASPLWREAYVAVVPAGHPLTALPVPLSPDRLAGTSLIAIAQPGTGVDPDTRAVLDRWDLVPDVAWRTEQPQTLANLVKAGLGVGLINTMAMACSETAGLVTLQVGSADEGRTVGLWRDPARYMSSASRALHRALLEAPRPPGTLPVDPKDAAASAGPPTSP